MTRFFVAASIVLVICVSVECEPQSTDIDGELNQIDNDDEMPDTDVSNRMGSAHAKVYVSNVHFRPGNAMRPQIQLTQCYTCVDCPKALANTTMKYCPYTNDPTKHNKCVVYAEKYLQMKKLWYIRGCASERGSCADIQRGHDNSPSVKLSFCAECDGDQCNTNAVSRSSIDVATALFILVLYPVFGKYMLT